MQLALDRGRRVVDLGEVEGKTFAVMAGMGLDAAMVDDAPTKLKAVLGPVAYVFSALKHLNDAEMKVEVQVDDYPVLRRRARTVIVGNVGRLQGGVNLLPDAEPDNGQMDVAVLAPRNLGHWIQTAFGVLRPGRHKVPNMEVLRGSRITVTSDRPQPRQLDGDVIDASRPSTSRSARTPCGCASTSRTPRRTWPRAPPSRTTTADERQPPGRRSGTGRGRGARRPARRRRSCGPRPGRRGSRR